MKLVITTPTLRVPHGGTRILNEWANHLAKYHDVTLFVQDGQIHCPWMRLNVRVSNKPSRVALADLVIIGSPHSIHLENKARRSIIFMQMVEHLFNNNKAFAEQCRSFYNTPNLLLSYSKWNIDYLKEQGRTGPIQYVSTGINLNDFPIERSKKENIVLVEGWECTNLAKDVNNIAPEVAARLRNEGYKILAYSQKPLTTLSKIPHEYYRTPSLAKMNELYSRAKILLKASKYDARAVAPLEAMTKGTPTVRAIDKGDDDLIDGVNCVRIPYGDADALYDAAKYLLTNQDQYDIIANECVNYVSKMGWDEQIKEINTIIEQYGRQGTYSVCNSNL